MNHLATPPAGERSGGEAPRLHMDLRDPRIGKAALLALMILAGLAVLYTLALGRTLFFPIVLALLLDSLLSPLVRFLVHWRIPRALAAAMVLVGWLAATAALLWLLFQPAMSWFRDAPAQLRRMEQELRAVSQPIQEVGEATEQLDEMTQGTEEGAGDAAEVEVESVSLSDTLLNNTGEVVVGVLLAIVLLYFLLAGGERMLEKVVELNSRFKNKRKVVEVTREVQQNVSRYLVTVTAINFGLGLVIGAGMWLLGLPDPLLWGVMAALLNYIPFIGLFIGSFVVFLVAAVSPDVNAPAIVAPAIYLAANAIEANFVTPMLLGRSVSLDPVVLILFFTVVAWMWSIGGAIVAVPLLAVIKIVCEHFEPLHPAARLIGR